MDAWVLWLIAAVILAVGEIIGPSFFLAPFAIGATGAAAADLVGADVPIQVIVFALLTAGSFAFIRPVARRHLRTPPQLRTNTAALVGRTAIVLDRIDNDHEVGTVRLEGEVWTARAYDDSDRVIEAGTRVQVIEIRGATALVSE
ncbi:MAG: NfeD family protein [Solirubrobacterales bacterium]|nr:NfeD family protein [Solirubrobacterales bacterium]